MKLLPYREDVDVFFVSKGYRKGERFLTNEVFGDVVLDVSDRSEVRGVEILCASAFFNRVGIGQDFLRRVRSAEFVFTNAEGNLSISLQMVDSEGVQKSCSFPLLELAALA